MGQYAPMSSCNMNGRNCPLTFIDDASSFPLRREEQLPTCLKRGEKACPLYEKQFGVRVQVGYKCRTASNELWACGGCPVGDLDAFIDGTSGEDCTEIPHADAVQCVRGKCAIISCEKGYEKSANGTGCLRKHSADSLLVQRHALNARKAGHHS
ncbi:hypothetical protein ONZ45_g6172 [Pleurotus djamor]|nr:hypothetical protein ONZ45_g6172 [Pleurotus djamor]